MNTYIERSVVRAYAEPWDPDTIKFRVFKLIGPHFAHGIHPATLTFEKDPLTEDQRHCRALPTFELLVDEAQALMDELWRAGVRPAEGKGSAGQLSAVERHLEDMRTLVFRPKATPPPDWRPA